MQPAALSWKCLLAATTMTVSAVMTGGLGAVAFADAAPAVPGQAAVSGSPAPSAPAGPAAKADDQPHFDRVVVNDGKDIVVGTEDSTFTMSFTVTDPSGVFRGPISASLFHGTWQGEGGVIGGIAPRYDCEHPDSATMTCDFIDWIYIKGHLRNAMAGGPWMANVSAAGLYEDVATTTQVKREAKLKAGFSGKKGKISATGGLTRADWDHGTYTGYAGRDVQLQFRKAGTHSYSTVSSVKTDRTGRLDTSVKAPADGYWRWYFPGDSTTGAAATADVHVDVRKG
ncbi:hypothetical protein [Planotetraspora kaengkrachanensis]|nr:hypothetical protein [Planotetraspora kaengkrachanensis]